MTAQTIKVSDVKFRDDLYPRLKQDPVLVQRYAEAIEVLPAIEVNQDNILIDGWHRWTAHRKVEAETIQAIVTETESDNQIFYLAHLRNSFERENTTLFWATLEDLGIRVTGSDAKNLIIAQPLLVEYVCAKILGASLSTRGTAGYDMVMRNGRKLQVKISTCGVWRKIKAESDDHLLIDCSDGVIKNAFFTDTERAIHLWSKNGTVSLRRDFPSKWTEYDLLCTMVNGRVDLRMLRERN